MIAREFLCKKSALSICIIIAMLSIIINPNRYIESASMGLVVFAHNVLPALFPFFFFTKLLTSINMASSTNALFARPMKVLYNAPKISGYILFMSLLSGYPVGARLISDAYENGLITEDDAKHIMAFTSVSGPLFIIGTVGSSILKNPTLGYIILFSHIIGALINGLLYRSKNENNSQNLANVQPVNVDNVLDNVITNAVKSILIVGGYIVIFYMLADMLYDLKILALLSNLLTHLPINLDKNIADGIAYSLIEMTKGLMYVTQSENDILRVAVTTGLISFGGLSITIQSITFLQKAKIKVSQYLCTKLTQAIISTIIATIIMLII